MKYIFIVNPSAGGGKALEISKNIKDICESENIDYIIHYTGAPKEATTIAETYKGGENIIYSVGGDGTLSEIVNGVIGTKNKLGVIPGGSGNDFYKTLQAVKELEKRIDVGKVNNRYFINVLSFGIDAEIGSNANIFKHKKYVPISQIYNASIIHTLAKFKFKKLEFILNGSKMGGEYTIVTICNGRFYGNGYNIAPNALLDDNLFDIYFVDKLGKLAIIKLVPKLKKGKHEKHPAIHKRQANSIKIKSEEEIVCNIDGEIIVGRQFDVKLIPNAVTIHNDKVLVKRFLGKS